MQTSDLSSTLIRPQWPAPETIVAAVTTRIGGYSHAPFDSFNLAQHVGDAADAVTENRRQLQLCLGAAMQPVQWLNQVHGSCVVGLHDRGQTQTADAMVIDRPGFAGAVLTADCLPVLFASVDGRRAAVAHAGWRGLVNGILERTLKAMAMPGSSVIAWLGPAIGPCHFEVGEDVRLAFLEAQAEQAQQVAAAFTPGDAPGKYYADLYELARLRLSARGITAIYGGGLCTVCDSSRFYSYRRDGCTGRMASVIGILPASR